MSEPRHFRNSPRPQLECRVELRRIAHPDAPLISALTRDLGNGGLFAATNRRFERGERIEVILHAPSTWDPLSLPGEVCWHKCADEFGPEGVGVRFTSLTDPQIVALNQFVVLLDYEA